MVHEKQVRNEESAVLLQRRALQLRGRLISPPLAYARGTVLVSQGAAPVEKFGAQPLIACLFLQNIFTLSTPY
jgi:hypothetical protein